MPIRFDLYHLDWLHSLKSKFPTRDDICATSGSAEVRKPRAFASALANWCSFFVLGIALIAMYWPEAIPPNLVRILMLACLVPLAVPLVRRGDGRGVTKQLYSSDVQRAEDRWIQIPLDELRLCGVTPERILHAKLDSYFSLKSWDIVRTVAALSLLGAILTALPWRALPTPLEAIQLFLLFFSSFSLVFYLLHKFYPFLLALRIAVQFKWQNPYAALLVVALSLVVGAAIGAVVSMLVCGLLFSSLGWSALAAAGLFLFIRVVFGSALTSPLREAIARLSSRG